MLAVAMLPISLLAGYQLWANWRQALSVEAAYQHFNVITRESELFRQFRNGAADAVDTGRVGRQSIDALNEAGELDKLRDIVNSDTASSLQRIVNAVALRVDVSALLPLQKDMKLVDDSLQSQQKVDERALREFQAALLSSSKKQAMQSMLVILISVGIAAFFGMRTMRAVLQPLSGMRDSLAHISEGDLTHQISVENQDEIGAIVTDVNALTDRLRQKIQNVKTIAMDLSQRSTQRSHVTEDAVKRADAQQGDIQQIAMSINQMSATVREVSSSAAASAQNARNVETQYTKGREVVGKAMAGLERLAVEIDSAAKVIKQVEADSTQIDSVIEVIRSVADQTNLLALNAAIEAARAGEHGRGFAVVADEVRTLASHTQRSTQQIRAIIEKLQTNARAAVSVMQSGRQLAAGCSADAATTRQVIDSIADLVKQGSDHSVQIAAAAQEQSTAAQQINEWIITIADSAKIMNQCIALTSHTTKTVYQQSEQLWQLTKEFKTGSESSYGDFREGKPSGGVETF